MRRREDPRLITGAGRFLDDLRFPDCLHVAIVRSPHAHARILGIDASAALKMPGVVAVVTAGELAEVNAPFPTVIDHPGLSRPYPPRPLATDRVRFVGEPVAAIAATDPYLAHDAVELVAVTYQPLPAVTDVEAAVAPGAAVVHTELGSNVGAEWRQQVGDTDAAFPRAEVVLRLRVRLARGGAHPLEPRGLVATADADRLTVWAAVQMVHRHRRFIARQLGLPEEQVRVVAPADVGGGFGTKGMFYPEDIIVPALARTLRRPVKWVETRREHALAAYVEREQSHEIELAATATGRVLGLRLRFLHEFGAYTAYALNLPQNTLIHSVGPYRIPNLDLALRGVFTNTTPVAAYRGAGRPQGTFVIERALDALARELRLDPIEIRRRNLLQPHELPYDTGLRTVGRGPVVYDSGDYPRCLDVAVRALDLPAVRTEQARLRNEGRYLGLGVVNYVEATGTPALESATVRLKRDGRVVVVTGAAPQGQGHVTVLSRVVGDVLGINPETIDVVTGDTEQITDGGGTFGSRTTALGGSAAFVAAGALRERAVRMAADLLEAAPADIICADGQFAVRGFVTRSVTWAAVASAAAGAMGGNTGLEETHLFTVAQSTFANGTHAAVVEVDVETGAVAVIRWVVAHDCGRVLNPTLVDGQIHGGIVQGLADALNEQLAHDETGQRLTATLMDYALATASDAPPRFEIHHIESPSPLNPLGAKGAGEGGIMPVHPVLAQAIEDALSPFGILVARVPVTRAEIRALIERARQPSP